MSPEIKVFMLATVLVAFAYMALYPRLPNKTLMRILVLDGALYGTHLLIVGLVYFGTATGFSVVLFDVPWWVFTVLCVALIEAPFSYWFCTKYNVDITLPTK